MKFSVAFALGLLAFTSTNALELTPEPDIHAYPEAELPIKRGDNDVDELDVQPINYVYTRRPFYYYNYFTPVAPQPRPQPTPYVWPIPFPRPFPYYPFPPGPFPPRPFPPRPFPPRPYPPPPTPPGPNPDDDTTDDTTDDATTDDTTTDDATTDDAADDDATADDATADDATADDATADDATADDATADDATADDATADDATADDATADDATTEDITEDATADDATDDQAAITMPALYGIRRVNNDHGKLPRPRPRPDNFRPVPAPVTPPNYYYFPSSYDLNYYLKAVCCTPSYKALYSDCNSLNLLWYGANCFGRIEEPDNLKELEEQNSDK